MAYLAVKLAATIVHIFAAVFAVYRMFLVPYSEGKITIWPVLVALAAAIVTAGGTLWLIWFVSPLP